MDNRNRSYNLCILVQLDVHTWERKIMFYVLATINEDLLLHVKQWSITWMYFK